MKQNRYKIVAPIGNIVVPKAIMSESELKDFAVQIFPSDAELRGTTSTDVVLAALKKAEFKVELTTE